MAETKYDEYFSTDCIPEGAIQEDLTLVSTRDIEDFGGGDLSVDLAVVSQPHVITSQPHVHEFPQYLHFFSANPKDPQNFDAEVEVCLGDEQEKHIITQPTAIYVPAGLPHGPVVVTKVNTPILFVDIAATAKYSRVGGTPD